MVKVRKDLTGQKFGRLIVIEQCKEDFIKPSGKREAKWLCQCNCGNMIYVRGYHLKSGHVQSCGCLQKEQQIKNGKQTENLIFNTHKSNQYDLSGSYGIGYAAKGEQFYFDLEDYDKIKTHYWYVGPDGYLVCSEKLRMHVLIMQPAPGEWVDHIKHNILDNRKEFLRLVTPSQNNMNRSIQSNNTSGITGVSFHKHSQKWFAYIKVNGKQIRKYAKNIEHAKILRKELENIYFQEYSYENSINQKKEEKNE